MRFNLALTLGFVLDEAHERGLRVDVSTTGGQQFAGVTVGALEQFCVVLVQDGAAGSDGKAHVVSRDQLVSVSLDRSALLQLEPADSRVGTAYDAPTHLHDLDEDDVAQQAG